MRMSIKLKDGKNFNVLLIPAFTLTDAKNNLKTELLSSNREGMWVEVKDRLQPENVKLTY